MGMSQPTLRHNWTACPTTRRIWSSASAETDALQTEGVLSKPVADVGQALLVMADVREAFQRTYSAMLDAVLAVGKPTAVCTIYDPNFDDDIEQRAAVLALEGFNGVITRAAVLHGLPVIDLRVLFDNPKDYANPIEPSVLGGEKLALAIATIVAKHDFKTGRSVVYTAPR